MSYITDHNAWAQRVGHEFTAYKNHLQKVVNNDMPVMTQAKFDKNTASNYNHCFANLYTIDQIREHKRIQDRQDNNLIPERNSKQGRSVNDSSFRRLAEFDPAQAQSQDYEGYVNNPYIGSLNRYILNDPAKRQVTAATIDNRSGSASKRPISIFDNQQSPNTSNIYQLVRQDIKMPEGLMYRGKYSSKTRNFQSKNPDTKSQVSNNNIELSRRYSDINGAKQGYRPRTAGGASQTLQVRGGNGSSQKKLTIGSQKKFYPVEYFKRVGYQFNQDAPNPITQENVQNMMQAQRQDLIIRLDKDEKFRFNEDLDSQKPYNKASHTAGKAKALRERGDLDQLSQVSRSTRMNTQLRANSKTGSRIVSSKAGRSRAIPHKKDRVSVRTSLKTNEILKKLDEFNKIRDNIEKQTLTQDKAENPYNDTLSGLEEVPVEEQNPNEPPVEEDLNPPLSQVGTQMTSQTMIDQLQQQLEEEKEARLELEREVEDLKRASATQLLSMSHRE